MGRHENDFYKTEISATETILDQLEKVYDMKSYGKKILEPSAGDGSIIDAVRQRRWCGKITAVELDDKFRKILKKKADYTNCPLNFFKFYTEKDKSNKDKLYTMIIGNPPYNSVENFVDLSLDLLRPGGLLVFLLRAGFAESKERIRIWNEQLNCKQEGHYTLALRPSYSGDGKTDSTCYVWYVFVNLPIYRKQVIKTIWPKNYNGIEDSVPTKKKLLSLTDGVK